MTDIEILATNVWNWNTTRNKTVKRLNKEIQSLPEDVRIEFIVDWFRKKCPDIESAPSLIPHEEWDIPGLVGTSENQLFHPHYQDVVNYHLRKGDKRHDILMVFECSNHKPYSHNIVYAWYMRTFGDYCDFALADYGLIPMSMSEYYPYRMDEWNHFAEGEYGSWIYREASKLNYQEVMDAYGYKKVLVVMQHAHPRRYLKELAETDQRIVLVLNDETDKIIQDKYSFGKCGIWIMRMLMFSETHQWVAEAVRDAVQELSQSDMARLTAIADEYKKDVANRKCDGRYAGARLKEQGLIPDTSIAEYPYGIKERFVKQGYPLTENRVSKIIGNRALPLLKAWKVNHDSPVIPCGWVLWWIRTQKTSLTPADYCHTWSADYWTVRKVLDETLPMVTSDQGNPFYYDPKALDSTQAKEIADGYYKEFHP